MENSPHFQPVNLEDIFPNIILRINLPHFSEDFGLAFRPLFMEVIFRDFYPGGFLGAKCEFFEEGSAKLGTSSC